MGTMQAARIHQFGGTEAVVIDEVAPPSDPAGTRRTGMVIVQLSAHKIAQLTEIGALLAAGTVQVVIDEVLSLSQIQRALTKSAGGHARGKIMLRLTEEQ